MAKSRNISFLKKIGFRIKCLREERSITQEVFCYETGINIGRIERAERDFSMTTLGNICKYLDITIEDFFREVK
jgi:DNA-binding XRE family transcriptional regulator